MTEQKEKPQKPDTPPSQVVIETYPSERGGKTVHRPRHISPQITYNEKGKPTPPPEESRTGSRIDKKV